MDSSVIGTVEEATAKKLIQLYSWQTPTPANVQFIEKEYCRIAADQTRQCLIVKNGRMISLFVNPVV